MRVLSLFVLLGLTSLVLARGPNGGRDLPVYELPVLAEQMHLYTQRTRNVSPRDVAWDAADPGALIKLTFNSSVGVTIDLFPEDMQDDVVAYLLTQDDTFWTERAKVQKGLVWYREIWRMYWKNFEFLQMSPNDESEWNIELTSEPYLVPSNTDLFDGHKVLAVDYIFTTYYVTDKESPAQSAADLVNLGGYDYEYIMVPVDPDDVVARYGYACMDEAEFPPGSVITPYAKYFFDVDCTGVEDPSEYEPNPYACHITEPWPEENCTDVVARVTGQVFINMTWTRVAWNDNIANQYRTTRYGKLTSPTGDMSPLSPNLNDNFVFYEYLAEGACEKVEGCTTGLGWRRLLKFDGVTMNFGKSDVHVGRVPLMDGSPAITTDEIDALALYNNHVYEYSDCHKHFHFQFYSSYKFGSGGDCNPVTNQTLQGEACQPLGECNLDTHRDENGNLCATGAKLAWCLESITRRINSEEVAFNAPYWLCGYQGVVPGWSDEYQSGIPCQWMDITGIQFDTSVPQPLSFQANPKGFLCEGILERNATGDIIFNPTNPPLYSTLGYLVNKPLCNYTNNWDQNDFSATTVTLSSSGSYINKPCNLTNFGPLRDCGWTELAPLLRCTPGKDVTVTVLGNNNKLTASTSTGDFGFVFRVCESSHVLQQGTACSIMSDITSESYTYTGPSTVDFTFTCPVARDVNETGGLFSLYVAPYFSSANLDLTSFKNNIAVTYESEGSYYTVPNTDHSNDGSNSGAAPSPIRASTPLIALFVVFAFAAFNMLL
eukprot:TRINITY_DN149_c0_g1_i2.p1 TRINITY_DN149_c0_g1~~TRINITY_DN149_c0_g1_i2.p1  ORF type:complete len:805 (+),score=194.98 TRINITY_DN149_c0_g1_i2:101-2416(+)